MKLQNLNYFQMQQLLYQLLSNMQGSLEDEFKFRSIIFFVFAISIIVAAIGVAFIRNLYFIFTFCCLTYTLIKFVQMVMILSWVNIKYDKCMISYQQRKRSGYTSLKKVTHVFILPNFKEDNQTLKQSILCLASHRGSKNYCVMLAMEAHQENSQEKAVQLISQFSHHFRMMSYTVHTLKPNEFKCKSSNINWCARNMVPKLLEKEVSMDTVLVTIMDSDSLIPEAYIDQVQCKIQQDFQNRHKTIFQPPQIFTKNQKQSAFFVRIVDTFMSYMHCSNLYSVLGYTMAVSNYTLSYRLLEKIDFWDTCLYSKGEDVRITSKAFWKTNGQTKSCPIYIPINQMNLSTKDGYWADFKARFRQAHRHSQDQTEISYNFVNMLRSPISFARKIHVFFSICEVYVMMIAIPIPMLVLLMQDVLKILPKSELDDGNSFVRFNNINMLIMFAGYFLYELFKVRASKALFGIKPLNIFYSIQVPLLQLPVAIIFGFIPMIMASFNMLTNNIIFTVTPKSREVKSKNSDLYPESLFRSQELEVKELIDKEGEQGQKEGSM